MSSPASAVASPTYLPRLLRRTRPRRIGRTETENELRRHKGTKAATKKLFCHFASWLPTCLCVCVVAIASLRQRRGRRRDTAERRTHFPGRPRVRRRRVLRGQGLRHAQHRRPCQGGLPVYR